MVEVLNWFQDDNTNVILGTVCNLNRILWGAVFTKSEQSPNFRLLVGIKCLYYFLTKFDFKRKRKGWRSTFQKQKFFFFSFTTKKNNKIMGIDFILNCLSFNHTKFNNITWRLLVTDFICFKYSTNFTFLSAKSDIFDSQACYFHSLQSTEMHRIYEQKGGGSVYNLVVIGNWPLIST